LLECKRGSKAARQPAQYRNAEFRRRKVQNLHSARQSLQVPALSLPNGM
jgi:hypothetical protein